jgi:uncharacterized DUF497 family protein
MRFTWDPAKKPNRRHAIAFEDASRVFDGPTVERIDDRFDYGELRVYAIGLVNGIEITVIYTDRDDGERHLIAAWRPYRMNGDISGTTSTTKPKTNWPRLQRMSDVEVRRALEKGSRRSSHRRRVLENCARRYTGAQKDRDDAS